MTYRDGPPYSEDEDLHSPVVMSSKHKKRRSGGSGSRGRSKGQNPGEEELEAGSDPERGYFAGTNGDGSETYYQSHNEEDANGPGGELVTYPPDRVRQSLLAPQTYSQRDSHFADPLPNRAYKNSQYPPFSESESESEASPPNSSDRNAVSKGPLSGDSRYSKDYQFTIASPDEEMHGKAVALFDFQSENDNELSIKEGQVIWVSYRQLQGWLVAQDPKTDESGLVPEEYVRLFKDIENGDWPEGTDKDDKVNDTDTAVNDSLKSPPITAEQNSANGTGSGNGNGSRAEKEKRPPVISTFSTSSKDLNPYPHAHRLPAGQTPPPVAHYGSQTSTPTAASAPPGALKRGSGLSKRVESMPAGDDSDLEDGR